MERDTKGFGEGGREGGKRREEGLYKGREEGIYESKRRKYYMTDGKRGFYMKGGRTV